MSRALEMALEALTNPSVISVQHAVELIKKELAKPKQEPVAQIRVKNGYWLETPRSIKVKSLPDGLHDLYTAPPRKAWVGLTNEDWENTPDTGKQGCERDAELFDWVEKTLKDKNT